MKIIQVTRQYYPAAGGIPTAIGHLTRHLQNLGHQVDVVALNRLFQGDRSELLAVEEKDGITIQRLPYWGHRRYAVAPSILRLVEKYDLVHVHSSDFFLDYLALTKVLHGKPLVLTSHGMFFHTTFARRAKKIYFQTATRLSLTAVSQIVCVSEQDKQLLAQVAPAEKLHVIPNGIEYETLSHFPVAKRDPNLIMSTGILTTNKRYDRMLRAFAAALKTEPALTLVIVGPDRGQLSSLEALSRELGIDDHVTFASGASDADLFSYYSQAKVWLSASEYESFGIALLEAMAAGCVPVVQQLSSFQHLLGEESKNLFADYDDPELTAQQILKAVNLSCEEQQVLTQRLRGRASAYSWRDIACQFEALYTQTMGG